MGGRIFFLFYSLIIIIKYNAKLEGIRKSANWETKNVRKRGDYYSNNILEKLGRNEVKKSYCLLASLRKPSVSFFEIGKRVMAQKKSELQKKKFEKVILNNLDVF